jgi:hypothetical protein
LCDVISAVAEFMVSIAPLNPLPVAVPGMHLQRCDAIHGGSGVTQFMVAAARAVNTREACYWSHAWQRFKRSKGVKLNGILESATFWSKTHTIAT